MANNLTDARRSLTRAKESANKRLEELEIERQEVKVAIKSLNAALKVLARTSGSVNPSPPPTARNKTEGQDSKQT